MKTICVTALSVMLVTAFCGGAFGAEYCRPTGEVLMLYGESAEWSPKCEVFVDGKRVAERDTADFGRMFAPTAYLVWKIGVSFDANAEHTLEIRPVFADGEPQEFRLGSICVAGRNAAWVQRR